MVEKTIFIRFGRERIPDRAGDFHAVGQEGIPDRAGSIHDS